MEQKKQIPLKFENFEGLDVELIIEIHTFPAMTGTAIRQNHSVMLHSGDTVMEGDAKAIIAKHKALSALRREHVLDVLGYAFVVNSDETICLGDERAANKHLELWVNVEEVFEAVLIFNGIDPHRSHEDIRRWELIGMDMAAGLVSSAGSILEALYPKGDKGDNG